MQDRVRHKAHMPPAADPTLFEAFRDWPTFSIYVSNLAASNFFVTLVAGAFGAAFGAWGAQAVISRGQKRQAVIAELNAVSAAHMLCFTIVNRLLGLKSQHVKDMRAKFTSARDTYLRNLEAARQAQTPVTLVIQADLETIPAVNVPVDVLQRHLFERISLQGRGLAAMVDLVGVMDELNNAIRLRTELIDEIRLASLPPQRLGEVYFGAQTAAGVTDVRFGSAIEAIYLHTDDCIYFCRSLADELCGYAAHLRRRYRWKLGPRIRAVEPADWSNAEKAGLMPLSKDYAKWEAGFRKKQVRGSRVIRLFRRKERSAA